ncbi:MAG: acyl-CoA thioesterase, partial [Gaiellaceae bacterium]
DEEVLVSCALARIGNSSITLSEQIRTRDGELAAEAEAVLVARVREAGRSRPLTDVEREAFERSL